MAPNQHHEDVNPESVRLHLIAFLDQWERGHCDDCSPTVADEAFDRIVPSVELGDRMRRIGLELAMAGQWMVEQESEPEAAGKRAESDG